MMSLYFFVLLIFFPSSLISLPFLPNVPVPPNKNDVSRQKKCSNLRCCQYRDSDNYLPINGVNCRKLTIEECVSEDDICVWDCDDFPGNAKNGKTKKMRGRFVKFDQGNGKFNENDEVFNGKIDNSAAPKEPKTIDEIKRKGSFLEYSPCGAVYEYNMDDNEAQLILNDIINGVNNKVSKDGKTVKYENNNNNNNGDEEEDNDIDGNRRRRRLLTIFAPDGRSQSTIKNNFPRRTIGLLTFNGGFCSATLISRRVILTAAHCVYDTEPNQFLFGWKFYPDATSSSDIISSNALSWSNAIVWGEWVSQIKINGVYQTFSASRDADYALIRLSTTNTGKGWMSFGYNNGLSANLGLNTFGYPGDKPYGTRWFQFCDHTQLLSQQTRSNICDVVGGQSGSCNYLYIASSGSRTIYAITSGQTSTNNYYSRIDSTKYNRFCDWIDNAEPSVC